MGEVLYHDGEHATDTWLRYHLADDWLIMGDRRQWPAIAEDRRRERAARPVLNVREVFYGRPLLEFIGRQVFAAFARQNANTTPSAEARTDEDVTYNTLNEIHAAWLLTPRGLGWSLPT